jgi:acid phosphatase type 7
MRKLILIATSFLCSALLLSYPPQDHDVFLEKPYLQIGDAPFLSGAYTMMVSVADGSEYGGLDRGSRTAKDKSWRAEGQPASQVVSAPAGQPAIAGQKGAKKDAPAPAAIDPHIVYRARLTNLVPGEEFQYRVLKNGKPVFDAAGHARKNQRQPFRFVLFGDCAQGTPSQNAIAYRAYLAKPDFLFITGDIVYGSGRISEYRTKFFPVYNADEPSVANGAPLLRSVPFIAAPGNHDTDLANFQRFPDALAYFLYWDQPLNGPAPPIDAVKATHVLTGSMDAQAAFREGAKPRYPRMANFSFDYGNSHWTVLDANTYMDWQNPSLREWLQKDLAAAQSATWRFAAFHQINFETGKPEVSGAGKAIP